MRKYFNKLVTSLLDDRSVAMEFFLIWLTVMVTLLVVLLCIGMVFGGWL